MIYPYLFKIIFKLITLRLEYWKLFKKNGLNLKEKIAICKKKNKKRLKKVLISKI